MKKSTLYKPDRYKKTTVGMIILLLIAFSSFAQNNSSKKNPTYAIKYAKSNNLNIRSDASAGSEIVGTLQFADKILVLPDTSLKDWFCVIYPFKGFVETKAVLSEKEIDDLYQNQVNKIKELDFTISGATPLNDLTKNNIKKTSEINLNRTWEKDDSHRVKIIKVSKLYLRKQPTKKSDSLEFYIQNEQIIIDNSFSGDKQWCKVVFPNQGYVFKDFLYNDNEINALKDVETNKLNIVEKSVSQTSVLELSSKNRDFKKYQKQEPVQKTTIISKENQNYIVLNNKSEIPDDSVKIWWTDKHDYNKNQFFSNSKLNLQINTLKDSKNKYKARIYVREANSENYTLIYTVKCLKPNKPKSIPISDKKEILKHGSYNFRIDVYDTKNQNLISDQQYKKTDLQHAKIETLPEDTLGSHVKIVTKKHEISVMGVYSPIMKPIELKFSRYKTVWGANIEYSKPDWKYSIGIGTNRLQAKSESKAYLLKTNTNYLYGKYTPFELLNNQLKFFATIGLTHWKSTFQNIAHPELPDYYPQNKAKGINALAGIGTSFSYHNFFIGAQYILYYSQNAAFGEVPIDPMNNQQLQEYVPTTQYKLFTGSNQFQLFFGYQFYF